MELETKRDLSVYYWVENLFTAYPQVTILDAYPEGELNLPSVVVEDGTVEIDPFEHGNRSGLRRAFWTIHVYANNKAQRTEFCAYIYNNLESGIIVYDYEQGFPPTVVPSIGTIKPQKIEYTPQYIFPELTEKIYWRGTVRFYDEYLKESA